MIEISLKIEVEHLGDGEHSLSIKGGIKGIQGNTNVHEVFKAGEVSQVVAAALHEYEKQEKGSYNNIIGLINGLLGDDDE